MKRLLIGLIFLAAPAWAQKPTVIVSGDGAATVVSTGTQGPPGANIPAGGSEGQGVCKSGAGLGWCSTFLCAGGNCSFTVPALVSDTGGIGFTGEPTTKFWRNLPGSIEVDFSGISGMRFESGALRLLTAGGTIYAGAASDAQIGREAASTWQLGADAVAATAQTLKGADSTGAGNPGGGLRLQGGGPGAGGTAGAVILDSSADEFTVSPTAVTSTVPVLLPAGTCASAPSISFADETSLGLCRAAPGIMGMNSTLATGVFARITTGGGLFPTELAVNGQAFVVMPATGAVSKTSTFELGKTSVLGVQEFSLGLSAVGISTTETTFRFMNPSVTAYRAIAVGTADGTTGLTVQHESASPTVPYAQFLTSLGAVRREVDKNGWLQGSWSKAITDNTASTFAGDVLAATVGANYVGGRIDFTIHCRNASNQAEQAGGVRFACHNLAGTITCSFGTPDTMTHGDGTASLGVPAFTAVQTSNYIDFKVQSDCTGIAPTTHTIEATFEIQPRTDLRAW